VRVVGELGSLDRVFRFMASQIPIVTLVARRGDRDKAPMAMANHSGEAAYPICSHNRNGPDVRGNGNARIYHLGGCSDYT